MTRILSKDEECRLLALIRKTGRLRDYILIALPLNTGLRLSEVAGLNWQDLTSIHGEVLPRFKLRAEIAKRHKPRMIELNKRIQAELEHYQRWYFARYGEQDGPLLRSRNGGTRLTTRQIRRCFTRHAVEAGIQGVTYHGLRHTFANKVNKRAGAEHARRLLGHENIQTTQIYIDHLTQDELAEAVDW